jgi:enamine deaminase RidA (YjgF/YER057c/UK114 family)
MSTFVVDYDHDVKWPVIKAARHAFLDDTVPAWTVVGGEALARPDLLIEIEATTAAD